ncbi:unnamed protein product [Symbiodinium natans]|uniref:Uncharacterized protein n=1 Tax=Symbiodinium natans TaxID=878477 RepID=A0A812H778_9DINO|nr:unnamed protein product [Symbiodinium natans]
MGRKLAVVKKQQKVRKRTAKQKARASAAVDGLADRLAKVASPAAYAEAAGSQSGKRGRRMQVDAQMKEAPGSGRAPTPREELKRKLKAKLAGHALDRTQGLEKGQVDSSGLPLARLREGTVPLRGLVLVSLLHAERRPAEAEETRKLERRGEEENQEEGRTQGSAASFEFQVAVRQDLEACLLSRHAAMHQAAWLRNAANMPRGDGDYEFTEQEQDGTDALNDDTFGDAGAIGSDWEPSLAQEAFHRELEQVTEQQTVFHGLGLCKLFGFS